MAKGGRLLFGQFGMLLWTAMDLWLWKKERVIALDPINEGSSIVCNMGSDCLAQSSRSISSNHFCSCCDLRYHVISYWTSISTFYSSRLESSFPSNGLYFRGWREQAFIEYLLCVWHCALKNQSLGVRYIIPLLAQGHAARKWLSRNWSVGLFCFQPMLFPVCCSFSPTWGYNEQY